MADWYISSLAGGGGVGTAGDPFTFAEGISFINTNPSWSDGDTMWIKADGTYSFTAQQTITNLAVKTAISQFKGYGTTIGDGVKATLFRSSGTGYVLSIDKNYWNVENFIIDGNSVASCFQMSVYVRCYNIIAKNGLTFAYDGASGTYFEKCTARDTPYGFYMSASAWATAYKCLAYNCSIRGYFRMRLINSVAYNCGIGLLTETSGGAFNSAFIQCTTGIEVDETWCPVTHNDFNNCTTAISYDDTGANAVNNYNNFYNNTTKSNDTATIFNDTAVDSEYSSVGTSDYRRTGNNLDFIGMPYVGGEEDYNLQFQIGTAPREITATTLPTFAGITDLVTFAHGNIKAEWSAGSGTISGYNIYCKKDNATGLFTSTYFIACTDSADTSFIIPSLADQSVLIDGETYYAGVRAFNTAGEETNSVSDSIVAIVNTGASAAEIWDYLTTSITAPGSIGKLLVDNIDADLSGIETKVDAIKVETDKIPDIKTKTDLIPANPATLERQANIMLNIDVQKGTGKNVPYTADTATRVTGDDDGGTVADIQTENGVYFNTGVTASGLIVDVVVNSTAGGEDNETAALAKVVGRYDGQANTFVLVYAYNYFTASWENRGIMLPAVTDFEFIITVNFEHRNGLTGEQKLRFEHFTLGPAPDVSNVLKLDYIEWNNVQGESTLSVDARETRKIVDDNTALIVATKN